jgi:subtilisin family serine protease
MTVFHRLFASLGRGLLVLAAILSAVLPSAKADQHTFYARGKAHTLLKSDTELGVRLSSNAVAAEVRSRMDLSGAGTLARLDGDKQTSRYRILRVQGGLAAARQATRVIPGVDWVRPVYRVQGCQDPLLSTGEAVVRFERGTTDREIADLLDEYGMFIVEPFAGLGDTYIIASAVSADADEVEAAAAMYNDRRVVYAHPDFAALHRSRQATLDDEFFTRQWHLNNTGQDGGTPGADIAVIEAWETTLGQDIRVGMLDDSCDVDHEDLRDNYLRTAQDINDGDEDPRPSQIGDRHGTAVMGLICAAANEDGVRGVAPNARFTVTRGLGFVSFSATASAYTFARQQEVDVHNNSWGFGAGFPTPSIIEDAIRTAFDEGRDGRGMVILFASGNESREAPEDISALPTVIAVGATNANDVRASYSNWGEHLDVMGPSGWGGEITTLLPLITTTDNTDDAGYAEPGYNFGGLDDFGFPNLPNPDYTWDFSGTSAASPIVAGVAALVLSANPELTATQVRIVLEHTADQVSPESARYDGVTSRSEQYAYGRVNAGAAVEAATQAVTNGGLTWPDRVANVRVTGDTLNWQNGAETQTILIARSENVFQWTPTDIENYDPDSEVTSGVILVFKNSESPSSYQFDSPEAGTAFFGIYARNIVGRYSWGVAVDSDGNVTDAGPIDTGDGNGDDGDGMAVLPINEEPKVSVDASPNAGTSPLVVTFRGNALTNTPIASTEWDFGDGSPTVGESTTTHTYTVADRDEQRFTATFTVVDEDGDVGFRSIAINVTADSSGDGGGGGGSTGSATVEITDAATGSNITSGFAPLEVQLSIGTESLPGVFESILWDLGDGTTATTVTVLHTYDKAGSFPVQATITSCHANGCAVNAWQTQTPVQFIEVLGAGIDTGDGGEAAPPETSDGATPVSDDGGQTPTVTSSLSTGRDASAGLCGAGLITVWMGLFGTALLRRWTR